MEISGFVKKTKGTTICVAMQTPHLSCQTSPWIDHHRGFTSCWPLLWFAEDRQQRALWHPGNCGTRAAHLRHAGGSAFGLRVDKRFSGTRQGAKVTAQGIPGKLAGWCCNGFWWLKQNGCIQGASNLEKYRNYLKLGNQLETSDPSWMLNVFEGRECPGLKVSQYGYPMGGLKF